MVKASGSEAKHLQDGDLRPSRGTTCPNANSDRETSQLQLTPLPEHYECQSLRPSSTSSSSSSSNNFSRRAYCSSLFFFCQNLKRPNESNPVATIPRKMKRILRRVSTPESAFFALSFVLDGSSHKPARNWREAAVKKKRKRQGKADLLLEIPLIPLSAVAGCFLKYLKKEPTTAQHSLSRIFDALMQSDVGLLFSPSGKKKASVVVGLVGSVGGSDGFRAT